MTEPDDRPGSDDPEDPSELLRLIGRTVPRSPHAGHVPGDGARDTPDLDAPDLDAPELAVPDLDVPDLDPPGPDGPRSSAGAAPWLTASRPAEPGGPATEDPDSAGPRPGAADDPEPEAGEDVDVPQDEPDFDELADDTALEHALEALLLVVDAPIDEVSLGATLSQDPARIRRSLNGMSLAYTADGRGIDLRRVGEGWRFYTRDRYAPYVERLLMDGQRSRLTRAALETLAVVAYRQPVTRSRVAAVRGVNCDGVLRTLLTRGLVEEAGTEEHTGGTLFRTTELFLERLGLSTVADLPPLAPLLPDIDAIDDLES